MVCYSMADQSSSNSVLKKTNMHSPRIVKTELCVEFGSYETRENACLNSKQTTKINGRISNRMMENRQEKKRDDCVHITIGTT